MNRTNKNAGVQPGADTTKNLKPNYTPSKPDAAQVSPSCGKAAAISAYSWGVLSLESCARLFRHHPEWARA